MIRTDISAFEARWGEIFMYLKIWKEIKKILLGSRYSSKSPNFHITVLRINWLIFKKLMKVKIIYLADSAVTTHWLTALGEDGCLRCLTIIIQKRYICTHCPKWTSNNNHKWQQQFLIFSRVLTGKHLSVTSRS